MRDVPTDNYAFVTAEFKYSDGVGYVMAYGGANEHYSWMPFTPIPDCKSRDLAELRALYLLVNGVPSKGYEGLTKSAALRLVGFDAYEKGAKNKHRANNMGWNLVNNYFKVGKDGKEFVIVYINGKLSEMINDRDDAKDRWSWTRRKAHADYFASLVKYAKEARAKSGAVAKASRSASAKADHAKEVA